MNVQEPNIKGLTSFGRKKESEKERRKKKREAKQQSIAKNLGEGITM